MDSFMESAVLASIENIEEEQAYAEVAVLDAMAKSYIKMNTLMEFSDDETIMEYSIFSESTVKKNKDEPLVLTILLAIPRFVVGIIKMIGRLIGVTILGAGGLVAAVALFAASEIGTVITGMGGAILSAANRKSNSAAAQLADAAKGLLRELPGMMEEYRDGMSGEDWAWEHYSDYAAQTVFQEISFRKPFYTQSDPIPEYSKLKEELKEELKEGKEQAAAKIKDVAIKSVNAVDDFVMNFAASVKSAAIIASAKTKEAVQKSIKSVKLANAAIKNTHCTVAITFDKDKKPVFISAFDFNSAIEGLDQMSQSADSLTKDFKTINVDPNKYASGEIQSEFSKAIADSKNISEKYKNPVKIIYYNQLPKEYTYDEFKALCNKFTAAQKKCKDSMEKLNDAYSKFSDKLMDCMKQVSAIAGGGADPNDLDKKSQRNKINNNAEKLVSKADKSIYKALAPIVNILNVYNKYSMALSQGATMMREDIDAWTKFYTTASKIKVK